MRSDYEMANFLVAAWRLAKPGERLPTSHGVLDRALEAVQNRLPIQFQGELTFVDSPIGRLCRELPDILRAAQESYLTSEPNPTYLTSEIKIGAAAAMDLLDRLSIKIEDGKLFGLALADNVDREVQALATAQNTAA